MHGENLRLGLLNCRPAHYARQVKVKRTGRGRLYVLRYYITDGRPPLARSIQRVIDRGVELVQIREKDLSARELLALLSVIDKKKSRILVNGRLDVAIAAGADGVHLPADSPSPCRFRALVPANFSIAVSCHSIHEVLRAEREGADFVVLGPIFATPSKLAYGEPLGLRVLHEAAHSAGLPVFALGGINETNSAACLRAGAIGIAGIRMFQEG